MEPGWNDPVGRILWLMQIGRNDEAFLEADHLIANAGWTAYENAAHAARQRTRRRADDPYADIRRNFLDDFYEHQGIRTRILNAVQNGYGVDAGEITRFTESLRVNNFAGMRHQFVAFNEFVETTDTETYQHRNAMNDVTNMRYRGEDHGTDPAARGENLEPDPAAPSSPLRQDLSFKEPFPPAGWLKRQRE